MALCGCGCGGDAPLATYTNARRGYMRGEPVRFIHGHNRRVTDIFVHGHNRRSTGRTPTYQSWRSMLSRCYDEGNKSFFYYGARGIEVCERWSEFENFLSDMGERPNGHSLDRIDPDGNYEPSNCRWATYVEQRKNQRVKAVA